MIRPFPEAAIVRALAGKQHVIVLERTDATIRELEQRRAHIDATLAELRLINATVRKQLGLK